MSKIMVIAGFGTGISMAVAEKFGAEGFTLALVARNSERLAKGVQALAAKGVRAEAFATDLSNPDAVKAVIGQVRAKLGPITVLHWNAYMGAAGDLMTAPSGEIRALFDVPVTSLVMAVQAALPDLGAQKSSAVLVTNGGLGLSDPAADAMAVGWNAMGLAVANAAKHKAVGVLAAKLEPQAIYVGEVVVLQPVKGTSWDSGNATLDASTVAARFWDLYSARGPVSVNVG
jgi:NADP-dependent 3-hydroxy acid dehydrogenase YdfG